MDERAIGEIDAVWNNAVQWEIEGGSIFSFSYVAKHGYHELEQRPDDLVAEGKGDCDGQKKAEVLQSSEDGRSLETPCTETPDGDGAGNVGVVAV
jgi:hypothetical protein